MLQNLRNFANRLKIQLDNLVDLKNILKNAYLLANIGADIAENERKFAEKLPKIGNYPTGPCPTCATMPDMVAQVQALVQEDRGGGPVG